MGEEYHKVLCIIGTGTIVHVWGCDEQNSSSPDSAQLMCPLVKMYMSTTHVTMLLSFLYTI